MVKLKIDNLRKEIKRRNFQWEVDEAQFRKWSRKKNKRLFGYIPGPDDSSIEDKLRLAKENLLKFEKVRSASQLPKWFDNRHVDGKNFMTSVKNQSSCNSCVAFAVLAAVEGTYHRNQNHLKAVADLSEAQLFFCWARSQGQSCDDGWWPSNALKGIRRNGVTEETCFRYSPDDQPCNLCTDASDHMYRITGWHKIESTRGMKEWLVNRGPLIACMAIYSDFHAYKSGVYRTTYDNVGTNGVVYEASHCVCCVGYDDALGCWICKNSWGNKGEDADADGTADGYFRIGYGDCGIDSDMYAIDGVYRSQSLLELFRAKNFSFPASLRSIAQTAGVESTVLISQLMEKIG